MQIMTKNEALYLCRLDIKASMFFLQFLFSLHCQNKISQLKFIQIHHIISFLQQLPLFCKTCKDFLFNFWASLSFFKLHTIQSSWSCFSAKIPLFLQILTGVRRLINMKTKEKELCLPLSRKLYTCYLLWCLSWGAAPQQL